MINIRNLLAAAMFFVSAVCFAAGSVNINSADAQTLASLKGIGPAKAAAIVADRDANGPFVSVEDLVRVKGIGEQTVEMNKEVMTVSDEAK